MSRLLIQRIAYIANRLAEKKPLNCTTVAEHFEVSVKTVWRDMEFLRDSLHFDLEYSQQEHTFRLIEAPKAATEFLTLASGFSDTRKRASAWLHNERIMA